LEATTPIEPEEKLQATNEVPAENEESISEPENMPPPELDPNEWHRPHNEWLHSTMRAAMGDKSFSGIPSLDNVHHII